MVQSLTQKDASEANHDMGETRLNLTAPELAWARDMVHGSEILDGAEAWLLGDGIGGLETGSPSVSGARQTR
jgi:hypothetical protein